VAYAFGEHMLDFKRRELRRRGELIDVEPQVFDLLTYLIRHRDRVVSKDDLLDGVWGGRIVSDSALTARMSALRRALGDNGETQRFIRTFPRKGVRFVAEVHETLEDGQPNSDRHAVRTPVVQAVLPLPDKPSIAVLPFAVAGGDTEQEFLADGIAQDVITALSRYPSLFVIARNSCFTYKGRAVEVRQVGRELGVRYVLEGSLRKSGNRIRVTAQFVEAETGKDIWAERYDRDLADIFAVQDEITEAVTVAVAPAIAQAERQRALRKPPDSIDAWAAYQRGLWHVGMATVDAPALAETFFQRAIDLDPSFASGYSGLAVAILATATAFGMRGLPEAQALAEPLAQQAVGLDPADAEAHSCLGWVALMRGDYRASLAQTEHALQLTPNLSLALEVKGAALNFCGRREEGLAVLSTSIRLDPRDPRTCVRLNHIALGLYLSGQYEAAIDTARQSIRQYPNFPLPYRWLAAALGQVGRAEEAIRELHKAIAVAPSSFNMYVRDRVPWMRAEDYAHMVEGLRKAGWEG
jgi:adenylate cyclase